MLASMLRTLHTKTPLRLHLDGLPRGEAAKLAERLGISSIYLLQLAARQDGREPSPELCVRIERATDGQVTRQNLRPDDWALIWPELAAAEPVAQAG